MSINEIELCKKFKTHIHFSGCAGLYNYFMGIADIIQKNYILDEKVIFSGSSGGNLITSLLLLNIDIKDFFYTVNKNILQETNNKLFGSLFCIVDIINKYYINYLDTVHGKNIYKKFNKNNNYLIFLNKYNPKTKSYENKTINKWNNNADLVDCAMTSGHIFIFRKKNNRKYKAIYKGEKYCDLKGKYIPVVEEMSKTIPTLIFFPEKWRKIKKNWYYPWTNFSWCEKLFKWGQEDALKNMNEFDLVLKRKFETSN